MIVHRCFKSAIIIYHTSIWYAQPVLYVFMFKEMYTHVLQKYHFTI